MVKNKFKSKKKHNESSLLKKKTVLIGLGNIGLNYDLNEKSVITHSKSIIKNSKLKFICGIDKSKKQRKIFEKKYFIKTLPKLKNDTLLAKTSFVVISTPNKTHLNLIKKIVTFRKVKDILLEKPGGANLKDFEKIVKLCKKNKINLYINYHRLYDKNYSIVKKLLLSMKKFTGIASYSRGLDNNCSHILTLLNCFNLRRFKIKILRRGKDPDFLIKFDKGKIFFFNNPRKNISNNEFEIVGDNLKIKSKDQMNEFDVFNIEKDNYIKDNYIFSNKSKNIKFDKKNSQKVVLDNIFNKKRGKNISKITEISYNSFKIIDKIKSLI